MAVPHRAVLRVQLTDARQRRVAAQCLRDARNETVRSGGRKLCSRIWQLSGAAGHAQKRANELLDEGLTPAAQRYEEVALALGRAAGYEGGNDPPPVKKQNLSRFQPKGGPG